MSALRIVEALDIVEHIGRGIFPGLIELASGALGLFSLSGYHPAMRFSIATSAAWACLVLIVLIAVLPSGTILELPSNYLDRALRYSVLASLLVVAYPKKPLGIVALVLMLAVGLELLQVVFPWKSASPLHLVSKILGSAIGILLGYFLIMFVRSMRRRR